MNFKDAFIFNDEIHQINVISVIRRYMPEIVLCNAIKDRHTDHAKHRSWFRQACFLSGLQKIESKDEKGSTQESLSP